MIRIRPISGQFALFTPGDSPILFTSHSDALRAAILWARTRERLRRKEPRLDSPSIPPQGE